MLPVDEQSGEVNAGANWQVWNENPEMLGSWDRKHCKETKESAHTDLGTKMLAAASLFSKNDAEQT